MIPLRLHLRNFMCYTDVHEPLQFEGIHVACLTGDNGHGKSALLDAITWALWGECRARSADDLIHTGQTEMEVEFEFQLGEGRYRVLRKRSRAGRGQTSLDLHTTYGDGLRALTGATVRETQARIVEVLGMTYETFVNSSFLVQGRADAFTVKPPGERKRILGEILELGRYDELEERARERAKQRADAVALAERDLATIEAQLATRPDGEADLARLQREHGELELAKMRAQTLLQALQERDARVRRDREELTAIEARLVDGRAQVARLAKQRQEQQARIRGHEATLAQAAAIDAGFARLGAVRAEVEALAERAAQAMALAAQQARHQREIDGARAALEARLESLEGRLRELAKAIANRPLLEANLERAEAAAARFQALQTERSAQERRLAAAQAEQGVLAATTERLREEFRQVAEHRKALAEAQQCPYCLTPLDERGRVQAVARCEQANADLAAQGKANKERLALLEAEATAAADALAAIEAEAQPLANEPARAGGLRQALEQAERDAAEQTTCLAEQERLAASLAAGAYAPEAQEALALLGRQLAALAYDADAHAALRQEQATLEPWEAKHRELERARENLPREEEILRSLEAEATQWGERLAEDETRAEALRAGLGDPAALAQQLQAADAEAQRLDAAVVKVSQELGAAKRNLEYLDFQQGERDRLAAQRTGLLTERGIYGELALAFGKKGIQAMIIESAIPEIERDANALLARMTDNRMHLKLETQRDTQKGDTVETLEIKVADELGTRGYELFSGGEAFRINFALRIALSKLAASRAGARLQTLIVDEGFGTQDADGLERLVEAIRAIQDDFERVLVITHVAEMKEVFPVRIEVRKTARGSVFQVV
jgi:DNA repair protein SbcC/Rad50